MNDSRFDLHTEYSIIANEVKLFAVDRDRNELVKCVHLEVAKYEPNEFVEPYMRLSMKQAQQMMNQLWNIGIRPHNGEGTNSHVEAMKYHLEDMRRLVFKEKGK